MIWKIFVIQCTLKEVKTDRTNKRKIKYRDCDRNRNDQDDYYDYAKDSDKVWPSRDDASSENDVKILNFSFFYDMVWKYYLVGLSACLVASIISEEENVFFNTGCIVGHLDCLHLFSPIDANSFSIQQNVRKRLQ